MATNRSLSEADKCWLRVLSTLHERQDRLFVAQRALELGMSGIGQASRLTGMSRPAIYRGLAELVVRGDGSRLPPDSVFADPEEADRL